MSKEKDHDPVNHPSHYTAHPSGIECIQITEHMNFCVGNAVKYLWRADHKNGLEDLKKAVWYINREIQRLEKLKLKPEEEKLEGKFDEEGKHTETYKNYAASLVKQCPNCGSKSITPISLSKNSLCYICHHTFLTYEIRTINVGELR